MYGFHTSYVMHRAGFSVVCNLICVGLLVGLTAAARQVWGLLVR